MDERNQFTFYRSFWEAVKGLPKKDRLPILEAIISYALDGEIPNGLTQSQSAFFLLVKPNLDASRKKAANGKQGGSKSKAKSKQTETKKENEEEKENEIEIEGEKEKKRTALVLDTLFESFWSAYPNQIARDAAKEAWDDLKLSVEDAQNIIASVPTWRKSEAWSEKGGKFIPRAAKFLADGYWKSPPASADKKMGLGTAELAAIQRIMHGEEEA